MAFADDGDLITRFKGGDLSGFEELVRKYQDRVYNLCRYMIQDPHDAQDAAQDVFLKAYENLKAFKPDASLYTWLYRIAVNTCLDYKKKSRPEQAEDESVIDDLASTEPSPEQRYQSKEIGQAIQASSSKAPGALEGSHCAEGNRRAFLRGDCSRYCDTSLGTVKSRISRAREELRRLLQKKV